MATNIKIKTEKTSKAYLSNQEMRNIQKEITKIFGEEVNNTIFLNIIELQKELNKIIQKVELIKNQNNSKMRIKRSSREKLSLMAEAYLIIFKVREFLLNEEIDYRYYYNIQGDKTTAKVINFKEKDLLKYLKFGKYGLQVANSVLQKQENDSKYQALLDAHYNNLMLGIQSINDSSFKVVHSKIMEKYEAINPGLKKQIGKGAGRYQVFTMGHIFEAMDIAFSEAMVNNQLENYDLIESYMYGKYLNYDSIPGTKGGDNPITMTQIKSNIADYLDYTTILKDLKILLEIFNSNNIDKNIISQNIENLYIDKIKYQDINDFNEALDGAVDKVLKNLEVNIS